MCGDEVGHGHVPAHDVGEQVSPRGVVKGTIKRIVAIRFVGCQGKQRRDRRGAGLLRAADEDGRSMKAGCVAKIPLHTAV